eukprot:scaffold474_cov169-Ochromonas_danica.AAC.23
MEGPTGCSMKELVDFDWSLKLALSSDKLSGKTKKDTLLELNAEELARLLKALTAAQKIAHLG